MPFDSVQTVYQRKYFMRNGLMAMEGIDELAPDTTGSRLVEEIDLNETMQDGQDAADLRGYTGDVSEQIEAGEAVDEILDQVGSINANEGVSAPVCEALKLAIQRLSARAGIATPDIAFESQSTLRSKRRNVEHALEGFKDVAKKIWEKIIEMLKRIRDFFKKIFTRQKIRSRITVERYKAIGAKVKAAKEQPAPHRSVQAKSEFTFSDAHIARILNVKGQVPQGAALVQAAHNHFHVMQTLRETAEKHDRKVISELKKAMTALLAKNTDFQTPLAEAFSLISSPILPNKVATQQIGGQSFATYEQPLVFGQMSYYRTAAAGRFSVSDKTEGSVHGLTGCVKSSSKGQVSVDAYQMLTVLELVQCEAITSVVGKYFMDMTKYYDETIWNTSQEFNDLINMATRAGDGESTREKGRARMVAKAINMYYHLRNSVLTDLRSYDERVCDALMKYVSTSIPHAS